MTLPISYATPIARALASKDNVRNIPSEAFAPTLLGLNEQVPAKIIYLTEGASKKFALVNPIFYTSDDLRKDQHSS